LNDENLDHTNFITTDIRTDVRFSQELA